MKHESGNMISDWIKENNNPEIEIKVLNECIDIMLQQHDEFAIKFANWCMEYKPIGRNNLGDMQYSKDDYDFAYTMSELLENYKSENL